MVIVDSYGTLGENVDIFFKSGGYQEVISAAGKLTVILWLWFLSTWATVVLIKNYGSISVLPAM